jgi:hypothetical protein
VAQPVCVQGAAQDARGLPQDARVRRRAALAHPARRAAAHDAAPAAAPAAALALAAASASAVAPAGGTAALAFAAAPVQSSFGGRAAVQHEQQAQLAMLAAARRDLDNLFAFNRVLRDMQQPAVPRPTEPIIRTEAVRKHNRHGCVVGSAEFVAARVSVAGAAIDVAAKRAATAAKFWARHRKGRAGGGGRTRRARWRPLQGDQGGQPQGADHLAHRAHR